MNSEKKRRGSFDDVDQQAIDDLQDRVSELEFVLRGCLRIIRKYKPQWKYGDNYQDELGVNIFLKEARKTLNG